MHTHCKVDDASRRRFAGVTRIILPVLKHISSHFGKTLPGRELFRVGLKKQSKNPLHLRATLHLLRLM